MYHFFFLCDDFFKFLFGQNFMCNELVIIIQTEGGKWSGRVLSLLTGSDMNDMQRHLPIFCQICEQRDIFCGKRTLIGIIDGKAIPAGFGLNIF